MSKEELNSIKEEIYQSIRELEKKIYEDLTIKTASLSENYEKYHEKLEFILTNNRNIIESIVAEKVNIEKLNALESFKNKADGMLISHEIRINNQNKDITNMKDKYDRAIEDNLIVPGFIGPKCQFNNIKEYIMNNNSDIARLKYEKDQLKAESKDFKSKFDGLFKQMIVVVDNSVEKCKEYTNIKILDYKKNFDKRFEEFDARGKEIRIDIQNIKTDIERQVNDLKLETAKINNFLEETQKIEGYIKKINNNIMQINYDINKLYDRNKNLQSKYTDIKNEIGKLRVKIDINKKIKNKESYNNLKSMEFAEFNGPESGRDYQYNLSTNNNMIKIGYTASPTSKKKNYSEKKYLSENRKKNFDMKEKKIRFYNDELNKTERKKNDTINRNNKAKNKKKLKEIRNINLKHMIQTYKINKNDNNEEKTETDIISEESLINNKEPEHSNIINDKEYIKNELSSKKSKNEDLKFINNTFREPFVNDKFNNEENYTLKKPEITTRRVSEIQFDFKTKSLKKVSYDISSENTIFQKIKKNTNLNSIDNQNNIIINNNIKDNSITSESNDNNKENEKNEIDIKINDGEQFNNNTNNIVRKNTISSQNESNHVDSNLTSSRLQSIKSLNDVDGESNSLSYSNNKKKYMNNNQKTNKNSNNDIINSLHDNNPDYFEEKKYIASNLKKAGKKLNFSQLNSVKTNTNLVNSNQQTNLVNSHYFYPSKISRNYQNGINIVGLNDENFNRKNSIDGLFFPPMEIDKNLKLERIGISSPNSQRPIKKKIKLQGLSTEAPLKIAAAFGRTSYTFIDKNNTKKLYTIKTIKKVPENEKLDVYFGSK